MKFKCSLDYRTFFDCGEGVTGTWTGNDLPDGRHSFIIEGKDKTENSGRHTFTWAQGNIMVSVSTKIPIIFTKVFNIQSVLPTANRLYFHVTI